MAGKRTTVTMPVETYEKMKADLECSSAMIEAQLEVLDWWKLRYDELKKNYNNVRNNYQAAIKSLKKSGRF